MKFNFLIYVVYSNSKTYDKTHLTLTQLQFAIKRFSPGNAF